MGKPEFGYPYDPLDGRERLDAGDDVARVLRGGSFGDDDQYVRCGVRDGINPDDRLRSRVSGSFVPIFTSGR